MHIGHATTSNPSPSTTITTTMRRLIFCGLLALLSGITQASSAAAHSASSNDSGSLNERSHHQHEDIFNPALAAAFKVGLANVASSSSNTRSSNKRANAFGKLQHNEGGHSVKKRSKSKRTPQVLSDLLGDGADVLDENGGAGAVVVLLEGGTVTSGSVSTVRVVPTTYTTTLQGERSECRHLSILLYSSLSSSHSIPAASTSFLDWLEHAHSLFHPSIHSSHRTRPSSRSILCTPHFIHFPFYALLFYAQNIHILTTFILAI